MIPSFAEAVETFELDLIRGAFTQLLPFQNFRSDLGGWSTIYFGSSTVRLARNGLATTRWSRLRARRPRTGGAFICICSKPSGSGIGRTMPTKTV